MIKIKFLLVAILLLLSFTPITLAQEQFGEAWSIPCEVADLDVSKDGSRVVMINSTGVYCFDVESEQLLWNLTDLDPNLVLRQVVTSADGGGTVVLLEVSAGDAPFFGIIYLNSTGHHRWTSAINGTQFNLSNNGRLIDISDDGDYVAAALNNYTSGENEYHPYLVYFNESATFTLGTGFREPTWYDDFSGEGGPVHNYTTCIDMSDDGSLVAIGALNRDIGRVVLFYPGADDPSIISPNEPTSGITSLETTVWDIAVSDDGYSAAAVTPGIDDYGDTLYYWSNVPSLVAESPANWTRQHPFRCVDISGDGDSVVTGTAPVAPCGVHYWNKALGVNGYNITEDWTSHRGENIIDVAVSDLGDIVAATSTNNMVYFIDHLNNSLGEFPVEPGDYHLEMSGDGRTAAVGGSQSNSLHVYTMEGHPVGGEIYPVNFTILAYFLVPSILMAGILIGSKVIFTRNRAQA